MDYFELLKMFHTWMREPSTDGKSDEGTMAAANDRMIDLHASNILADVSDYLINSMLLHDLHLILTLNMSSVNELKSVGYIEQ